MSSPMKHEKNQSNYNYQYLTFILISTRNSSLIKIQIKPITNVRYVLRRIKKMLNDNAFSLKDLVFCSLPPPPHCLLTLAAFKVFPTEVGKNTSNVFCVTGC